MKLKNILKEALEDFDTAPMPGMDNGEVLELPNSNFTISVFREEKKLLFTPQEHSSLPDSVKELVYTMKEYFNISKINNKDNAIFEVEFDPRQDFNKVLLFIQEQLDVDEGL